MKDTPVTRRPPAFARREELTPGIDIRPDRFEAYLRDELGLQVTALPAFERVRYDIPCESMRTGHIYGIFFDGCSLLAAPDVLSQCELEYLRSRSVLDTSTTNFSAKRNASAGGPATSQHAAGPQSAPTTPSAPSCATS
ncbi:hypothetical protein OG596_02715 [Streptomyces sp. NBC_01102]|uniref:hypothetical protein n=1 Tax=unclassified Streptomyces TaxID=2593676 RepID=UPI00386F0581|nr:hypothetical protein OG596_02715 [Streptomyces sp. NBC_01102]